MTNDQEFNSIRGKSRGLYRGAIFSIVIPRLQTVIHKLTQRDQHKLCRNSFFMYFYVWKLFYNEGTCEKYVVQSEKILTPA